MYGSAAGRFRNASPLARASRFRVTATPIGSVVTRNWALRGALSLALSFSQTSDVLSASPPYPAKTIRT